MSNVKVAFICVHNSCRSQIAEAFGRHLASDVFQSYSAGTETKPQINQDAVRIMKELYNIDMEAEGQLSKLVSDIPDPDIAISMGCNVGCPFTGRPFDDNWGLEDPTGKSDEEFKIVIEQIKHDILELKSRLNHNEINISYFKSIIDQDRAAVVICNLNHEIIYMNPAAVVNYGKRGGDKLIGRSLLECHNKESQEKIRQVTEWFAQDESHNIVYTFHNEKQNKDVYMVALRDSDKLIGYYEKHEYRDRETMKMYDLW